MGLPAGDATPSGYTRAVDLSNVPQNWVYLSTAQFYNNYGHTNPLEDFATCLEGYYALSIGQPGANALTNWESKYDFIHNWLNGLGSY